MEHPCNTDAINVFFVVSYLLRLLQDVLYGGGNIMVRGHELTLRLIMPQWQGGNVHDYYFGSELLAWLLRQQLAL